jgi:hypothetical protein
MADTLERLQVEFQITRNEFTKELGEIQNQLSGITNTTQQTSKAVGGNLVGSIVKGNIVAQVLVGTLKGMANKMYNFTKEVAKGGSELSRMRIATNTLARNMGVAQVEIDNLRDSLAESNTYGINAERTIKTLAMSGLMDMAKSLKTVDARTGETIVGMNALVLTMKDLGAMAGLSSEEGINRITRFVNRAEVASVEGMIAIGNMATEYREYAKTLGKSRMDLTAQEEAQARLNIVMREGKKALGAYADAYTTSGKMIDSIGSSMSNIFQELGAALEPIWATVSSAILNFVQGVRDFLVDNTQVIMAWATRVAGAIVWLVKTIGSWLSQLPVMGDYLKRLADFQVKSAGSAESQAEALDNSSEAMDKAKGSASKLKKELMGLAGFDEMNVLKEQSDGGGGGDLGGFELGGDKDGGGGLMEGIGEAIGNFAKEIGEKMKPIMEKIKEFFAPIAKLWNDWVVPAFKGLVAVLKELWDSIMDSPVGEILKTLAQVLGIIIVGAIGVVIYAITGLVAIIKWQFDTWKENWDKAIEWIANAILWFRDFGDNVKNVWGSVRDWFVSVWESITGWFNQKIAEIRLGFEILRILIGMVIDNIKNNIKNRIDNIKSYFTGLFSTVSGVFNNIGNTIWNVISNAVNRVRSKLAEISSGFANFGYNVVVAIKNPINNVIGRINSFLNIIRGIKIPVIAPSGIRIPNIPYLAQGGVISSPTVAMLGEAGKEAVMPLERNTEWIDKLAEKINTSSGGGGNLIVKIGDDTIYEKAIDYIREKGLRTGTNILNL